MALAEVFKLKYADMAAQVNIPAHGIQTYLFQDRFDDLMQFEWFYMILP